MAAVVNKTANVKKSLANRKLKPGGLKVNGQVVPVWDESRCILCDAWFESKEQLTKHFQEGPHKDDIMLLACQVCGEPFFSLKKLKAHLAKEDRQTMLDAEQKEIVMRVEKRIAKKEPELLNIQRGTLEELLEVCEQSAPMYGDFFNDMAILGDIPGKKDLTKGSSVVAMGLPRRLVASKITTPLPQPSESNGRQESMEESVPSESQEDAAATLMSEALGTDSSGKENESELSDSISSSGDADSHSDPSTAPSKLATQDNIVSAISDIQISPNDDDAVTDSDEVITKEVKETKSQEAKDTSRTTVKATADDEEDKSKAKVPRPRRGRSMGMTNGI